MESNPVDTKIDNSLAAIFTMMLPGLGQLLKNQIIPGIMWSLAVGGGYLLNGWLGLGLHLLCILNAAFSGGDSKLNKFWINASLFTGLVLLIIYTCLRTALF